MSDHDHHNHDHSQHNMDMDPTDHTGHDMSMHSMMSMAFHFGTTETVLFDFWKFTTVGGLIGSMIGIFIIAALYEGLKYYREYLFWRAYNLIQYRSNLIPGDKTPPDNVTTPNPFHGIAIRDPPSMFSANHGYQTALHVVQIIISYFLMLIFMTYNVWLGLAVVLGSTTGFFLFGWKKSIFVDVTEHCH